jgi:hypothetical protein
MQKIGFLFSTLTLLLSSACLPPSNPYPVEPPDTIVQRAEAWSDSLEDYIEAWTQGQVSESIPDELIPQGIEDSRNFYLKDPDLVTPEETWAIRKAKPINKDSLYAGIPDPRVTYLFLGTALAPFGSKLVIEGEFPHCRFFSIQASPPLNGKEYYSQRQFGPAEVSIVDADIEPLPGHTNPFRPGADRTAQNRSYRVTFDLTTGDPVALNDTAFQHPYRYHTNNRKAAMLVYQGPLGYQTIAGTPLPVQGDWNLGCIWIRYYAPDDQVDAFGGVPLPKVYYELPNGEKYFIGSNFSKLQQRADATIANRVTAPTPGGSEGPSVGWFKSWSITRSILNGVCQSNNWSRIDSGARVRDIDLGWTGRGEFQPPPANIEPHATTNNYATYLGRNLTVPEGKVAVLTGRLPTFPSTRNGEPEMGTGQVRYWSICGIDQDPLSPMPATTIHAISDDEVVTDALNNYVIVYSRPEDRPSNALASRGVSWVDWGTQSTMGILMRWVNIAPDWTFPFAPQEHNLSFSISDWAATLYDSTLIGVNWRRGFMQCYLPRVHLMDKEEFEALTMDPITAEDVPVWVDPVYTAVGPAESHLATVAASSVADTTAASQPQNVIDRNTTTCWASAFGQQDVTFTVDLGSVQRISAVKLNWDWIFFGKDYTLEVSNDGNAWSPFVTAEEENGQTDVYAGIQGVSGRFVRLNLTRFNVGFYRLAEFEVYTSDCRCDTEIPTHIQAKIDRFSVRLYPNPARETLWFQTSANAPLKIECFSLKGERVWVENSVASSGVMAISPQLKGVYLLRFSDSKGRQKTERVILY